jgi:hypothetical protein
MIITDITLAPRNAPWQGQYDRLLYLETGERGARQQGLLFDVTNRGNKITYLPLNFPFRAPPDFPHQ